MTAARTRVLAMGRVKAATHHGREDLAGDRAPDAGFDRGERVSGPLLNTAFAGNEDAVVIEPTVRRCEKFVGVRGLDGAKRQHGHEGRFRGWIEAPQAEVVPGPLLMLVQRRAALVEAA